MLSKGPLNEWISNVLQHAEWTPSTFVWLHRFLFVVGEGKDRVGTASLTKLEVSNLIGQFLFCFSVSIAHKFKWSLSNGFRFLESKDIAIFLDTKHAMRSVFPLHLKTQAASFSSHTASGNWPILIELAGSLVFWLPIGFGQREAPLRNVSKGRRIRSGYMYLWHLPRKSSRTGCIPVRGLCQPILQSLVFSGLRGIHNLIITSPKLLQYRCDFSTSYRDALLYSLQIIQFYFDIHFLSGRLYIYIIININLMHLIWH